MQVLLLRAVYHFNGQGHLLQEVLKGTSFIFTPTASLLYCIQKPKPPARMLQHYPQAPITGEFNPLMLQEMWVLPAPFLILL